jgi:hypothetical protein
MISIPLFSACASIDRPSISYKDSPNDPTKERIYAWTPGAAAAIGVDQYGQRDENNHSQNGVKFCVLTAATARTSTSSLNFGAESPTAKIVKIDLGLEQSIGALVVKNESAAATFLDIGMFHVCMLNANPGGISNANVIILSKAVIAAAAKVAASSAPPTEKKSDTKFLRPSMAH